MKQPTIFVTGATGKTGTAVVTQLREQGWPVRAVVRSRDARSEQLDRLGAETVVADLFDAEQLTKAMHGTERAYYCPPFHPYMIQSAVAFAVAARETRIQSIVGLTQWLASPSHPSFSTRQHWLVDRLFSMLPEVSHTIVNPGFFAEFPFLAVLPYAVHLGIYPMPSDGESRNAPPSNADIARVAVAALTDPDRHAGKTYRPTGPEMLSIREMAKVIGVVFGRKVRHVNMPLWMFYRAARADGLSPFLLSGLRYYLQEQSQGTFAFGGPTTDVLDATGEAPESFETIVRRHASRPINHRSIRNTVRTFSKFMTVPFYRGFNGDHYEQQLEMPMPESPLLNMNGPRWKQEHERSHVHPATDRSPFRSAVSRLGVATAVTR